jgi:hypothetical protein
MIIVVPIVLPELTRHGFKVLERVVADGSSFRRQTQDVVVPSADELVQVSVLSLEEEEIDGVTFRIVSLSGFGKYWLVRLCQAVMKHFQMVSALESVTDVPSPIRPFLPVR